MGSHTRPAYRDIADAVTVDASVRIDAIDSRATPGFSGSKKQGRRLLADDVQRLDELQERLFAEGISSTTRASVLLIIQGMDTAGKGGIVRHVVGSVDPQGVTIHAFKAPTAEEREHDFLWRIEKQLPEPGMIGVFDRSQYEDVLVARVRSLADDAEIERRYGAINDAEARWAAAGVRVVKVMLHISPEEQKGRLTDRLDRPEKHWKFAPSDIDDRELWPDFQDAYQVALERTAETPWAVIPADRKWYARLAVQSLLIRALEDIDPQWPLADFDVDAERRRLAESL